MNILVSYISEVVPDSESKKVRDRFEYPQSLYRGIQGSPEDLNTYWTILPEYGTPRNDLQQLSDKSKHARRYSSTEIKN
ncbi:hypothetical protein M8J77_018172 [Diaphorina citri]|nr:hypothetical protein M8J77_018172 [Diaphorina citri]